MPNDPTPREEAMLQRLQSLENKTQAMQTAVKLLAQLVAQTAPGAIDRAKLQAAIGSLEKAP
jgi:hypothetical protein